MDQRYGIRANPYPAIPLTARTSTVWVTAMTALLASDRAIGTDRLSKSSAMLPHCRLLGNRVHSGDVMSASVERPFRSNR